MTCESCQKDSAIFDLHCSGCRDRLVMGIDCKLLREIEAKDIEKKFGFLPDYAKEPSCGCIKVCKRKAAIKHEQQTDRIAEKAPRRR